VEGKEERGPIKVKVGFAAPEKFPSYATDLVSA